MMGANLKRATKAVATYGAGIEDDIDQNPE